MAVKGNNFDFMSRTLEGRSVSGKPAQEARMDVFKKDNGKFFKNPGFQGQGKLSNQNISKSVN